MEKKLIFLGSSPVGAVYLPQAAIKLGYQPVFILDKNNPLKQIQYLVSHYECYQANADDYDSLLQVIAENKVHLNADNVAGVTSFSDVKIQNACRLASQLGVAGPDKALLHLIDKFQIQQMIPEYCPKTILFTGHNIPNAELMQLFDQLEHVILKPTVSYDALGIFIITKNQVPLLANLIKETGIKDAENKNWIAQPIINGQLVSVEGYVLNKEITILGFSKRARFKLTEVANHFPVDKQLSAEEKKLCKHVISILFKKTGFSNGYFHSEFIFDKRMGYFIDANVGRVAGGAISQQLAMSFQKDPVDVYCHIIDVGIFHGKKLGKHFYGSHLTPHSMLVVHYGLADDADFIGLKFPASSECLHTQFSPDNMFVPAVGKSDHSIIGSIAGQANKVENELSNIQILTKNGVYSPFYVLDEGKQ